ncbi:sigma factor-like helix-turn-helix DNA-binding protein [Streptomyces afghaniensis]|uniref:sigma factor-like helix-turn-helix DNA-binding protein n=1 Tax=Streptomyces afghaniensis TaxID=66865 RepID=UPI0037B6988F
MQHLPSKQRATLLLREVLGFSAREVADLRGCTVASVNSALQRARATLDTRREATGDTAAQSPDAVQRALGKRYAAAFSSLDMEWRTARRPSASTGQPAPAHRRAAGVTQHTFIDR